MRLRSLFAIIAILAVLQSCSKHEYLPKQSVQQVNAPNRSLGLDALTIGDFGIYNLLSNTGGSVEIANASIQAGGTEDVNVYTGSAFQKWKISKVTGGYCTIMNVGSTMYAETYNFSGSAALLQAPASNTDAQLWSIVPLSPTTYKVINKLNGLAATCNGNATIQLKPFTNLPGQIFSYVSLPKTYTTGITERRTPVFFGTVDEGPGLPGDGQMAALSNPANYSQWQYVRTHADGYVQCFIPMDGNNKRATPLANLQAMSAAFTNKGCYYAASTETSVQASGDPENDSVDRANIDQLIAAGFNVNSAAINYGTNPTRTATMRTYKSIRPCLQLWGPFSFGGNINSNYQANALIRSDILATDGISFDGPMGLWYGDIDQIKEGAYSAVAFAHANGKLASMDLSPSPFFGDPHYNPATNFLSTAKSCVMEFEDNNDALDEWDLYLYQGQFTAIFPEVNIQSGTNVPVNSQTGFGYWLIRHLNTLPLMQIPNTGNVGNNTTVTLTDNTHAQVTMKTTGDTTRSYSMLINFSNKPDTAIELSPIISAAISGSTADWQVTFSIEGKDVTNYVLNGGLPCISLIRLTSSFTLPLIMTIKALNQSAQPVTVNFITAANVSNTANKLNYSVMAQTQ